MKENGRRLIEKFQKDTNSPRKGLPSGAEREARRLFPDKVQSTAPERSLRRKVAFGGVSDISRGPEGAFKRGEAPLPPPELALRSRKQETCHGRVSQIQRQKINK